MILLLETLHPDAHALLAQRGEVVLAEVAAEALRAAQSGNVQGILTRGKGKITRELMQACGPSLKVVSRCGAGLDTVDTAAAKELGIRVIYAPGLNAQTTAEHTLMLMLAAGRRLATLNNAVKAGNWAIRNDYEGIELNGKTLGIIGLGNIGQRVAQLGAAFGMKVVYWNRSRVGLAGSESVEGSEGSKVRRLNLANFTNLQNFPNLSDLLRTADVVSLHVALNGKTKGMIGTAQLALMKPTAILVNTARGGLIDQQTLAQALALGKLGAFGGDVLDGQPPDPNDPLLKQERAILTPHVGGLTDTTYREVCLYCAKNVQDVIDGKEPDGNSVYIGS